MTAENTSTISLPVSEMAENLIGSEIIKLAQDINEKIAAGEKIFNLTIGDFNPAIFPIPAEFRDEITRCIAQGETNYPVPNGMPALRKAIAAYLKKRMGVSYAENEILVSGGARPLIYSAYRTVVDPGDTVLFPVPSWNNNHYSSILGAKAISVETKPENNFMPTAAELRPYLPESNLLALCSPLNPTGTVFSKDSLMEICEDVVAENRKRQESGRKPLYIIYDQIYWTLTHGSTQHFDPVGLCPELKSYTIFIDGMSKAFAATGVRVGWAFGPAKLIDKMKSILSHVGAWAPKAEQVAASRYLVKDNEVDAYLKDFKASVMERLQKFYDGFSKLKADGLPVDAIAPQAAIYLTIKIDLKGLKRKDGSIIATQKEGAQYVLDRAGIGLVPFSCFGSSADSPWYRLSVGTCQISDVSEALASLRSALEELQA